MAIGEHVDAAAEDVDWAELKAFELAALGIDEPAALIGGGDDDLAVGHAMGRGDAERLDGPGEGFLAFAIDDLQGLPGDDQGAAIGKPLAAGRQVWRGRS